MFSSNASQTCIGQLGLELQPALSDPEAPPLLRTMALLLEREERLPSTTAEIRARVAGTEQE
ncbi:MAG: hypothetical protein ACK6BC_05730, partial [Cyanobacteriota bacterium]